MSSMSTPEPSALKDQPTRQESGHPADVQWRQTSRCRAGVSLVEKPGGAFERSMGRIRTRPHALPQRMGCQTWNTLAEVVDEVRVHCALPSVSEGHLRHQFRARHHLTDVLGSTPGLESPRVKIRIAMPKRHCPAYSARDLQNYVSDRRGTRSLGSMPRRVVGDELSAQQVAESLAEGRPKWRNRNRAGRHRW